MPRRLVVAVWAGLCVAGGAATLALNHGSAPAPSDGRGAAAEDCAEVAAEYARWLVRTETQRREAVEEGAPMEFRPAGYPVECEDEMYETYTVVHPDYCRRLADDIEAERRADTARTPTPGHLTDKAYAVPQECADDVRE